ncbi:MAG: hypothetical protein WBO70_01045 [Erysipelotrichaceae bacterium]
MSFGVVSIIGIVLIVEGVLNLLEVMIPYAATMTGKYTPESMKAWIRPMGVSSIIMGSGCMLIDTSLFAKTNEVIPSWYLPVGIGLAVTGVILGLVFNKVFLKKIK